MYTAAGAYNYPGRNNFALYPREVTFTPDLVNVGTVILSIENLDVETHELQIAGVTSRLMGANGGMAVIRVTFKRPGTYGVALLNNEGFTVKGGLKVIQ